LVFKGIRSLEIVILSQLQKDIDRNMVGT
jgi:hypothetical protein